jgi:hypothetical protein
MFAGIFEDFTATIFYQNISKHYQNTRHHIPEDTIVELAKVFSWAVGIRVARRGELSN